MDKKQLLFYFDEKVPAALLDRGDLYGKFHSMYMDKMPQTQQKDSENGVITG
jgi:hypothetical protein